MIEGRVPIEPLGDGVEHLLDCHVLQDGAGGVRAAGAQQVLLAEVERIALKRTRDHIGVALIGPHQLRDAEAAQGAGRRQIGVERVGIDRNVIDVVGARRGETRFLRHPRADVGKGAAVPPHVAFARHDLAVLVDAGLDAERARMLGDGVEHLVHGERDFHRSPRQHRQRYCHRFQLDVELAAVAAAEIGHLHTHAVFRPAEQAGDFGAHEGRALRGGGDGGAVILVVGDSDQRLERQMQHLLRLEGVLEHLRGGGEGLVGVAAA